MGSDTLPMRFPSHIIMNVCGSSYLNVIGEKHLHIYKRVRLIACMFSMMKERFLLLKKQQDDLDAVLTSLWVECYDVEAHLSCETQKLNILLDRLRDANESLTPQAISNIGGDSRNTTLRRTVLLMTLKRNDLQLQIETLRSIICDLRTKFNTVLRKHDKLCRESNIIDTELTGIGNAIGYDTRMIWNHIYASNSF